MLQLSDNPKTRKAVCSQVSTLRKNAELKLPTHLYPQISAGAAAARCDDTASLKSCIVDYILADTMASRQLGLERKGKKGDRGYNHPVTASLLCPMKYMPTEE